MSTRRKAPKSKAKTTDLTLDAIQNDKNKSRHLRSLKGKSAKLRTKIRVWSRSTLNTAKGLASGIPPRPGIRLTGTEADPGSTIKPYLDNQIHNHETGALVSHIAGSPVVVCKLAEKAEKSSDDEYVDYIVD